MQKRTNSNRTRIAALAVAVLGATTGVVLGAGAALPAAAHNYLVSTNPAADTTVAEQPGTISITTNDVLLDAGGEANVLRISGPDGYYGDGCTVLDGPSAAMSAVLGTAGTYTVAWQVVSADGHPIAGEFVFDWQPAAGQESAQASAEPPVCGEAAPVETPAAPENEEATSPTDATDEPVAEPTETAAADDGRDDAAATAVGVIVGIGAALAVLVIAALVIVIVSRRRSKRHAAQRDEDEATPSDPPSAS